MNNYEKGREFENFVHYVYSNLIKLKNSDARISKRTTLRGRSGSTNEFDIYYEFFHLGILHKVAIECKNYSGRVPSKEVRDFVYKVNDVGNVVGIMISKNGYQMGAENIANHDYIKLLTIDELPSFTEIVSMQIRKVFLPEQNVIGEPFWTIMERGENNDINGNYMTLPNNGGEEYKFLIPLFFLKLWQRSVINPFIREKELCGGLTRRNYMHYAHFLKFITMDLEKYYLNQRKMVK
ncbi:restriction endonuclease [Bacillus thuringiensis]|uniref:restriction endonuclease n=1 Tax=Bacillus thuringiensis TaxID=1428 RepID=UPI0002F388C5|nr:restriction endonuclease [Bacillus thuringiensis]